MDTKEAEAYLAKRQVPQLFESMLTGLMYHCPEDPIGFLERCLHRTRQLGGLERISWDTFINLERTSLPPMVTIPPSPAPMVVPTPPIPNSVKGQAEQQSHWQSKTTVTKTAPGLGAARRYERLPPIQAQISIDSDSDMTESSGLIQEYEVFDPSKPRPLIVFLIGGPGSGKGTQAAKLARHFQLECVSVGEILRNQLLNHASSDRKWEIIAKIIANGELAPQETTIEGLKQQFISQQGARGFLVDGFPRDIAQAFTFQEQIGSPDLVILLACSNRQLRVRLERRAALHGRPDDNSHAIEKRLATFKHNMKPIAKYYQERALITRIDAEREEEEIFTAICAVVRERLFPDWVNSLDDPTGLPTEDQSSTSEETVC